MRPQSFLAALCLTLALVLFLIVPARADLVGYWDFSNSRAELGTDRSGHNNTLTPATSSTGSVNWYSGGKNGGCLDLYGLSTSKLVGGSKLNSLPLGNSPYTVSVWVKNYSGSSTTGIVGWGTFAAAANQCNAIRFDNTESVCGVRHYWWGVDLPATGSQVANAANGAAFNSGSWVHVATRYDGATRAIYVNGYLVASDTPGVNGVANVNFNIGQTWTGDGTFNGYLDDVAIWNTALPVSQIQALAANTITPLTGPKVTTFASNIANGYEGGAVQLSWTVDATNNKDTTTTIKITQGSATVYTGSVTGKTTSSGNTTVTLPNVSGNIATSVPYVLTATDSGTSGSGVFATGTVSVTVAPNVPSATAQSGLAVVSPNALPITLSGTDPGNVALTYSIVVPPFMARSRGARGRRARTRPTRATRAWIVSPLRPTTASTTVLRL